MNTKRNDMIVLAMPSERFTPFSLAKKLGAKAILESASFSHGKNRYSILMLDEAFRIVQDNDGCAFVVDGNRFERNGDILDALAYVAGQNESPADNLPVPGAGIGYLSYEFCARCDTIRLSPQEDELHIPESAFIVGHTFAVFDHFSETIHLVGLNYTEHAVDLQKAIGQIQARMNDMDFSYLAPPAENRPFEVMTDLEQSHAEYTAKVEKLRQHIIAGDIVQAVPSRRLRIRSDVDAMEIYRKLRMVNPSPYLFYLNFGTFQLTGASPESLVRVRGGKAAIHPIAGTRRRGKNSAEDELLKMELSSDPKERAEHLMLVDLARNDLGRVCKNGSVTVTQLMECELYSHVIHLVSEVTGIIDGDTESGGKPGDLPSIKVLRASFPAGTVSGAPKISAIEILSKLEPQKRGFYAGSVGYLASNGDLDFCIAIRCALKQNDVWTLQAGGGIVYGSNPEREWEETNEKLGAMIKVLTQSEQ